jgi:hypothetical protein
MLNKGSAYTDTELEDPSAGQRRQRDLSRQMTVLIDVVYALVLVQGAEAYRSLFTRAGEFEHISAVLPVALALALIYFTAIQSFIDYHFASEEQPYQFLHKTKRKNDLLRFYLDVLIVGLYSFVLLKCHVLLESPGGDLTLAFLTFPAIFLLYIVWGWFRKTAVSGTKQAYSPWLLLLFLGLYGLLTLVYVCTANGWVGNSEFLFAALLLMIAYRLLNWRQKRWRFE